MEDPNVLALIGSRAGDERNAMTASWITQLSMEPVLIGVAVDNEAITCRLIADGGSFTINLWDATDTRVFVKFSKPAVDDGSTLNGRAVPQPPVRPCSRRPLRGWIAKFVTDSISARTRCSSGKSSTQPSPTMRPALPR